MKYKVVFWVEDEEKNPVIEKSQIFLELTKAELIEMAKPMTVDRLMDSGANVDWKMAREKITAISVSIGRLIEHSLHIDRVH